MGDNLAIEITVSWDDRIMSVDLLVAGKGRYVIGGTRRCDFPLDADALGGLDTWTLVDDRGTIRVPASARDVHLLKGQRALAHHDRDIGLEPGDSVSMTLGPARFDMHALGVPERPRLPMEIDLRALAWGASGVTLFVLTLVLLWLNPPASDGRLCRLNGLVERLAGSRSPTGLVDGNGCAPREPVSGSTASPGVPAGMGLGMGSGSGTIPITGTGTKGSGASQPLAVTDAELESIFGYPVCIRKPDPGPSRTYSSMRH